MKKLKKLVSLLAAVAICVLLPGINTLTASAAEPVTYSLKFVDDDVKWRFQVGSAWNDEGEHRELYYMLQDIKNGDSVVIHGTGTEGLQITIPVHLKNLTLVGAHTIIITANGYDECFVLSGSIAAINGDITDAYVYENAAVTFNNSIKTLRVLGNEDINSNATVAGTVNHLIGESNVTTYYDLYNIAAGKLVIENGSVMTEEAYYSKAPDAAGAPAQPTTQQTVTQAPTQSTTTNSSSGEYDDVPKTGENTIILQLLGISALCLIGKRLLRRTA